MLCQVVVVIIVSWTVEAWILHLGVFVLGDLILFHTFLHFAGRLTELPERLTERLGF